MGPPDTFCFTSVHDLEWKPHAKDNKQVYNREWMESVIEENLKNDFFRDSFNVLLPPETIFSQSVQDGANASHLYSEVLYLIHTREGHVAKRRGLQIKKALACYYMGPQCVQDANDHARQIVQSNIPTITQQRTDISRSRSNSTSSFSVPLTIRVRENSQTINANNLSARELLEDETRPQIGEKFLPHTQGAVQNATLRMYQTAPYQVRMPRHVAAMRPAPKIMKSFPLMHSMF